MTPIKIIRTYVPDIIFELEKKIGFMTAEILISVYKDSLKGAYEEDTKKENSNRDNYHAYRHCQSLW